MKSKKKNKINNNSLNIKEKVIKNQLNDKIEDNQKKKFNKFHTIKDHILGEPRFVGVPLGIIVSFFLNFQDLLIYKITIGSFICISIIELLINSFIYLYLKSLNNEKVNQTIWTPKTVLSYTQLKLRKFTTKIYKKTTYKEYELNLLYENIKDSILMFVFIVLFAYKIKSFTVIIVQIITLFFYMYNNVLISKYIFNKNTDEYKSKRFYLELYCDPIPLKKQEDGEEGELEDRLVIYTNDDNNDDEEVTQKTFLDCVNEDIYKYNLQNKNFIEKKKKKN